MVRSFDGDFKIKIWEGGVNDPSFDGYFSNSLWKLPTKLVLQLCPSMLICRSVHPLNIQLMVSSGQGFGLFLE